MDELKRIQDRISRIFGEYPERGREEHMRGPVEMPSVDVAERGNDIVVTADMPGVDKGDIRLDVTADNVLEISAEKKAEKKEEEKGYVRHERSYTGYYRTVRLPAPVDKTRAKASYNNGVLEVTLPMTQKAGEKKSEIQVT